MQESIRQGRVVSLPAVNTIADGTAVKTPGSNIFPYIQKNVDEIVTVDDHELIVNFLDMVENHKMIVENSGLLSVSARPDPEGPDLYSEHSAAGPPGRTSSCGRCHSRITGKYYPAGA